ncbi:hypothetical protein FSP39_003547 [Pinctada imbricata]|uniref:Uncharacterized protein n=1 Tax=Pinctada imbricata TaxID=66713 RepID=A0AA88XU71_PINIB|nr:hypothetical protein FSP39_003547 [Pinctada imbricata]
MKGRGGGGGRGQEEGERGREEGGKGEKGREGEGGGREEGGKGAGGGRKGGGKGRVKRREREEEAGGWSGWSVFPTAFNVPSHEAISSAAAAEGQTQTVLVPFESDVVVPVVADTNILSVYVSAAAVTSTMSPQGEITLGKECEFWKRMVSNLNQMQESEYSQNDYVQCDYHPEKCEQLDCRGFFRNPVLNFTYCWGMIVNHCDDPISIDIYLQIKSRNIQMTQRVTHNTTLPIPGLSFDRSGTKIGFVMAIELKKNDNNSITVGYENCVDFKIRVKTSYSIFGSQPFYPTDLQKQVIPPTALPVSMCNHTTKTPNIKLGECGVAGPHHQGSTTPRPAITDLPPIVKNGSQTYNKSCSLGLLVTQCHPTTEICKQTQSGKGVCDCKPEFNMCPFTGFCSTYDDCRLRRIPPGYVTPARHNQNIVSTEAPSNNPINRTALIIGSVCGDVALHVILM